MNYLKSLHKLIHSLHNTNLTALFLRLALGIVFINAGWMKFNNMDMTLAGFKSFGLPEFLAYYVTFIEIFGGVLLLLGVFVRYLGILFAINMLTAMVLVHWSHGFSVANFGYEYVLVLMLCSMALVTIGSGRYSLVHIHDLKKKP